MKTVDYFGHEVEDIGAAGWLAMDENGDVFYYECYPALGEHEWRVSSGYVVYIDSLPADNGIIWKRSVMEIE